MSLRDKIHLIPRLRRDDSRGWFLKVITGQERASPEVFGEVYLTMARPGQIRGNHYHQLAAEWFTVVQGSAHVVLQDPQTGERHELVLRGDEPRTLFVPAGIGHAFQASSDGPMLLLAHADRVYEAADTVELALL